MILSNNDNSKLLGIGTIPGFVLGFEWDWQNYCLIFDLGIIRLTFTYKNPYATAY